MGRINVKSVIVGGLVAGVVLNVIDFLVYGVWLAPDMAAMMQAAGKPPVTNLIPLFVVLDFIYGIALIYLYAAIRPRFGAGPGTAVKAGIFAWILVGLLHSIGEAPMGLMPQRLYVIGTLVALIEFPLAAVAGAKFYREV
ncbi:MAG: hypothetical protein ACJ8BF_14850 [Gemmatimonadales bacterium]